MITESYRYRGNSEFKQRDESSLVFRLDYLEKFGYKEELRFNDMTEKKVFAELCNPIYRFDGGTRAVKDSLVSLLKEQDTTPEEVVQRITENESVMNAMATMWEAIRQRDRQNYPFILSVLHAELPLSKMNDKLGSIVDEFEEAEYNVEPFSSLRLCDLAEGYLVRALATDQAGTDGRSFLLKTTKDPNKDNVGFTVGLSTIPLKAKDQGVVVPYMWYRPTGDIHRIKEQVLRTGEFSGSYSWEPQRQFHVFDFNQMSNKSFSWLKEVVNGGQVYSQKANDEMGTSHI